MNDFVYKQKMKTNNNKESAIRSKSQRKRVHPTFGVITLYD